MSSLKPLTREQQQLVISHRKIAGDHACQWTRHFRRFVSLEEARSIADMALCRAAAQFDPSRGYTFWTYLSVVLIRRCREAIARERRATEPMVSAVVDGPAPLTPLDARRSLQEIMEWAGTCPDRLAVIATLAGGGTVADVPGVPISRARAIYREMHDALCEDDTTADSGDRELTCTTCTTTFRGHTARYCSAACRAKAKRQSDRSRVSASVSFPLSDTGGSQLCDPPPAPGQVCPS